MTAGARTAPLHEIRVLDFTHAAAGPFATMWLADLGAEVIKVEKPGRGDGSRYMGEALDGTANSDYYSSLNRNKKGVLIDLHSRAGVDLARKLASMSDVVVQNFRPGVMERLGLGFDDLAPLRSGLIYCSISAFGGDGPWRDRPANDIIMQGVTGLMALTGEADGDPVRVGTPVCDYSTGLFGLVGILAALISRDGHPEGQHIEVNMFDSTIAMMANYIPAVLSLGRTISRHGRGHAQLVPYQAFRCADGQYLIVGAFTDGFWRRMCAAIGLAELLTDSRFTTNAKRITNRDALIPVLENVFSSRPRVEWLRILGEADVPTTPVLTLGEALASAQAQSNGTVVELVGALPRLFTVRMPIHAGQWPAPPRRRPPTMGADTSNVLGEVLGLSASEVELLVAGAAIALDA